MIISQTRNVSEIIYVLHLFYSRENAVHFSACIWCE